MDRAEFLGYIMKGHKYNVAVAGTHGKTTYNFYAFSYNFKSKLRSYNT